jgi:hypothetical protein
MIDPHMSADGSTLFFATPGLINSPAAFADLWQVPLSQMPSPPLSIKMEKF